MFISSTGGHLGELLQLQPLFPRYSYSLVTEKTKTTKSLKQKHKHVGFLVFGSKDHKLSYPFKLLYNCSKYSEFTISSESINAIYVPFA